LISNPGNDDSPQQLPSVHHHPLTVTDVYMMLMREKKVWSTKHSQTKLGIM